MKPQKEAMLPQGIRAGPRKREIPTATQSNITGRSQQGNNQSEQGEHESRSSSSRARREGRREETKRKRTIGRKEEERIHRNIDQETIQRKQQRKPNGTHRSGTIKAR